ncbi:hypothetical protein AB0J14_28055 [Micromonospora arborensis]|uniref:hypothetical protein n=1 Tax=Micromonospora arborensis TaxID=2116518 RepID=UPI0033D7E7B0
MSSKANGAEAPAPRWSLGAATSAATTPLRALRRVFTFMVLVGHSNILGFEMGHEDCRISRPLVPVVGAQGCQ